MSFNVLTDLGVVEFGNSGNVPSVSTSFLNAKFRVEACLTVRGLDDIVQETGLIFCFLLAERDVLNVDWFHRLVLSHVRFKKTRLRHPLTDLG